MLREAGWLVLLFPNGPLAGGTLAGQLVGAHPGAALHHGFSVGRASPRGAEEGCAPFSPPLCLAPSSGESKLFSFHASSRYSLYLLL